MTHAPHDFALVIGINDYPHWGAKGKPLQGPVSDAQAFAAWLRADNGGGLPCDHVRLVTSTPTPLAPFQHQIDAELAWINLERKKLPARRRFYFYFAGHGHIRLGQGNEALTLCLPNWSYESPGAALHLQSYINASLGCFGFEEGVYFLDCCRVEQVAPIGKTSDWECPSPQLTGRFWATAYAAEHLKLGYEGSVDDEEIRGYFTSALIEILQRGPIALPDLKERLEELVPVRSSNKQFPRIPYDIPTARARTMIFGPPTPPAERHPSSNPEFRLTVKLHSNLRRDLRREEIPAPAPGIITVLDAEHSRVAAGRGTLNESLPQGTYLLRIEHGEAVDQEQIELDQDLDLERDLPRRSSAAPLSNTLDSHEWLAEHAYHMSHRENVQKGEEGILVFARYPHEDGEVSLDGRLSLYRYDDEPRGSRFVAPRELVLGVRPGNYLLQFHGKDARSGSLTLPIPVAPGWDTLIFFVVVDGRPVLERATLLMQEAGLGFNKADALLDAYERALIDLVSGRPDLDDDLLEDLLWGKYKNPLFGLVGAHFLLRRLANGPSDPVLRERADIVIRNVGHLLGHHSPDVQALEVQQDELLGRDIRHIQIMHAPVLRPALLAMFRATTASPKLLNAIPFLNDMALGALLDSPWNCWRTNRRPINVFGSEYPSEHRRVVNRFIYDVPANKVEFAREILKNRGFSVTAEPKTDGHFLLRGTKSIAGDSEQEDFKALADVFDVPSELVEHFAEELERASRLGLPVSLVQHTRRSALPISLVAAAVEAAKAWLQTNPKGRVGR